MHYLIAKIVNIMQSVYVAWNSTWWNYHCGRAHPRRSYQLAGSGVAREVVAKI